MVKQRHVFIHHTFKCTAHGRTDICRSYPPPGAVLLSRNLLLPVKSAKPVNLIGEEHPDEPKPKPDR